MQSHRQRISSLLGFAVTFCCTAGCNAQKHSAQPIAAATTTDAHTWHLKREERSAPLTDWQTHQSRTFKMMSMLLPVGWQLDVRPGTNFATIDCADTSGRIIVSAANLDETLGVLVLPTNASMSTNNQAYLAQKQDIVRNFKGAFNCSVEQPLPLAQNLTEAATKLVPGAQIVGQLEPVPSLSDEIPAIVADANQRGDAHLTAEAGRLRLTATLQSHPVEMYLVALSTHRTVALPSGGSVTINDLPLAALSYAPPGQLDRNDKLLMTVLSSIQIDPDWTRNAQHFVAALYEKINGAYATVKRIHQQMAWTTPTPQPSSRSSARTPQTTRTRSTPL